MRTVVIGHGRSPEGKGWGEQVDACDRVIRLWNWHWQDPVDYGTRYDWGLIEIHSCFWQWKLHNQREPAQGWVASVLHMDPKMVALVPPKTLLIDQQKAFISHVPKSKRGIGETGHWHLTRGGVAACWAINTSRAGDNLLLFGFDNVFRGSALPGDEAFSKVYQESAGFWGMNGYKAGATKEGNHDYPAERRLIEFLADRRGVTVDFTNDVWPEMPEPKPPRGPSTMPLFRYIGEYPEGQTTLTLLGCEFSHGSEIEIPGQFTQKARANRFLEEIIEGQEPGHVATREQMIRFADAKGIKVDRRWNDAKIAEAIQTAEGLINGEL